MNPTKKPREDRTIWRDSPLCAPWTPVPLRLMRHWHRVGWQEADPDNTGGTIFVPVGDACFTTLCWVFRWARHDVPDGLCHIDMSIRGAARERGIESSTISKHLARLEKAGIIVGAHQKPRDSGLPPDGLTVGRKLAGGAVRG